MTEQKHEQSVHANSEEKRIAADPAVTALTEATGQDLAQVEGGTGIGTRTAIGPISYFRRSDVYAR